MSFAQLLDTLRSPERWTRRQAKRLLFDGPEAEVLKAADLWVSGLDPKAGDYEKLLLEVIGVYESHETARPELLAKLLAARDWRVRAYGARVVGAWAGALADPLSILRERIHDESPRTRLEALLACSYVGTADAAAVAVQVTDSPRDKFIDYAMAQVLRSLETEWKPALAAQTLRFANPAHAEILRTLAGKPPEKVHPGKLVYETLCLNCHQPDGKGLAGIYPPLAGSEWVTGDKNALIRIVLHGLSGPISVGGIPYGVAAPIPMPPMGLDDQQAADVLSYVRETFGNGAPAVTPTEVSAVRAATSSRTTFWTAAELADSPRK
jgi:mono/diheme cytochrome c family protein